MILKSKIFGDHPSLIHGFTTRELGSDYARIGAKIGVPADSFRTLNQIHSDKVVIWGEENSFSFPPPSMGGGEGEGGLEGDALITQKPGVFVGIRTADCVPILVFDPAKKVVAAIHAGWKGILVGIIENSIREMREKFGSDPSNLVVAVGPTLCPGCFEIGEEVADQFKEKFGDRLTITSGEKNSSYLDLKKAVELILTDLGVLAKNIDFYPQCNKCREDLFFSFRGGDEAGRMLSFIGLKSII